MTPMSLLIAIARANEFIKRADKVRKKAEEDPSILRGSKETAACRRASMELTNALVDVRGG